MITLLGDTMSAVVFLCLTLLSTGLALPEGWITCKQSSPDFKTCIHKAFFGAIHALMPGNKALGTMPLDPLTVERMEIPKHPGPVSVDITFTNFQFTGLKNMSPTKLEFDWKDVYTVVYVPRMVCTSGYKIDGKILTLPIKGEGMSNFTMEDVDVDVKLSMGTTKKDGVEYITMDHFIVDIKPKHMTMYLDNLFNGDKALGDTTNTFLNENWKDIFNEFQPALQKGLSVAFSAISNQILSKIPADQIKLQ